MVSNKSKIKSYQSKHLQLWRMQNNEVQSIIVYV